MKLLIAGGGTGGHVFPALAVAREWLKRDPEREVVFVGTERGMEARLVPEAGLPLETVRAAGLKGIGGERPLRQPGVAFPPPVGLAAIFLGPPLSARGGPRGVAAGPKMLAAGFFFLPPG